MGNSSAAAPQMDLDDEPSVAAPALESMVATPALESMIASQIRSQLRSLTNESKNDCRGAGLPLVSEKTTHLPLAPHTVNKKDQVN